MNRCCYIQFIYKPFPVIQSYGKSSYDAPFLFPYIFGCAFGEYYYRKVKELTVYES